MTRSTDTKAETIRYYEREAIRPAADRTDIVYRDYSDEHLATLTFLRCTRELGFSMAQVRELLALSDHDAKPSQDIDQLVSQQLVEIDRKNVHLGAPQRTLTDVTILPGGQDPRMPYHRKPGATCRSASAQ
ncbi:MAG: MerR family DNA-binding protein [Qipengyuania pacifica]